MFRPIWPSSGVKICSGGNFCYFVVTAYVVPVMRTCVVVGVLCVLPLIACFVLE
jgi:hypothetical protein